MSRNRRNEAGYVAIVVSIIVPVVFIGLAAVSVDVARWYVEIERVQKAADAAALAGVTHMPHDLPAAEAAALAVSARNGYPNSGRTSVDVAAGTKPSELRVTVSSTIDNAFGAAIGLPTQTVSRSALTDYTGPAPMGSPCNTFGNEPPSNSSIMTSKPAGSALLLPPPLGAGFANCSSNPQFWTSLEAPTTNKAWGDRYTTRRCVNDGYQAAAEFCSGGLNTEYREDGYYFVVRVLPAAVGVPIQLQLYDPAYVQTGRFCENMPPTTAGNLTPGSNPYFPVGDTTDRFKKGTGSGPPTPSTYCTGDFDPDALVGHSPSTGEATRFDTTFVLREQTDTLNPSLAPVVSGCVKQYRGHMSASNVADERTFKDTETSRYNRDLARVFHQWVDMCTFTAPREGDHYLQVRSNVQYGGTREAATANTASKPDLVLKDNPAAYAPTGNYTAARGVNNFGMRAVIPSDPSLSTSVSVAGWERMPIYANATAASSTFNLVRVIPAAAGKSISFSFFDVGDVGASVSGKVTVLKPTDATGTLATAPSIPGCKGFSGPVTGPLTDCTVDISNATHNGKVQTVFVPIPADYNCDNSTQGGCWFRVQVSYPAGTPVNDITTWDADVNGNPVRLVE